MKTPRNLLSVKQDRLSYKALPLLAALMMPAVAMAQTMWIAPSTSDFNNPANWNGTYIGSSNPNCANDAGSNNVVLIQPGDPVWQHGDTLAGNGDNTSGAYLQTGSTNNTGGGNWLRMGLGTNSFGSYILSNGVVNVGGRIQIGERGTGYLEIDNGTMTANVNATQSPCLSVADGNWSLVAHNSPQGTVVINGGILNITSGEVWFGNGANDSYSRGTGHLIMHGGELDVNNWFVFGRFGGVGDLYMDGGVINKSSNNNVQFGVGTMDAGADPGTGTFTQYGGTFNCASDFQIGTDASAAQGTATVGSNAVLVVDRWLVVGRAGATGTLNISGNAAITKTGVNGGNLALGGGGGNGTVTQDGGTVTNTATQTLIARNGYGSWTLNSGSDVLGMVLIGEQNGGQGFLYLNGGDFTASEITTGTNGAASYLYLNGGTIIASANNPNFLHDLTSAEIDASGVTFDSQGYDIGVPQQLFDGGGGLTKVGSGTLTLSGANMYSGNTTVSAGTLNVGTSSTTTGSYTVADNAALGTMLQAANAQLSVSSLTAGSSTGAALNFDLGAYGNPTSAPLNVSGTYTANGTITINVAASIIQVGTIPLIQYASLSGSPTYVLGSLPLGTTGHLQVVGSTVNLVVDSTSQPRWDGSVAGQWDLGTNQDWVDLNTLTPTAYTDGTPVLFDDNATGTTTVDLTEAVSPASVTFNNNTLPYSIVGSGSIGGNIGLTLNGTNNVSILNTGGNNFTGPVVLNNGTLTVTNLTNGGSPSAVGASSADPTNLMVGATLNYGGAPVAIDRGFTIASSNATIAVQGDLTMSGQVTALTNALTGGSKFNKAGPGQLTLADAGQNEFAHNTPKPGLHVSDGTLVLDGSAGGQTNHTESEFWIGSTAGTGGSVILTNTTLISDSWLGMGRSSSNSTTSALTLYNSTYQMGNCSLGYANGVTGYQGTQILTLNGDSVFTNKGDLNLGESSGANLSISLNGNSLLYSQNRGLFCMGNGVTGDMTLADNSKVIINSGWFSVGAAANANASLVIKGSASFNNAGDFNVTDVGTGCSSIVTVQDNGQLNINNLYVGKDNGVTAILNITNNATVMSTNGLTMATFYDTTARVPNAAIVNLAGGSLAVNLIQGSTTAGTNNGIVNFDGGKLIIHGPYFGGHDVIYTLQAANILGGGLPIEVDNADYVRASQPLLGGNGDGGLTKLGTGTLYLDGANTYTNTTLVSAGTLGGSGTIEGPVTIASGATLMGDSGTLGSSLTINNTLTLQPGSTTFMNVTPSSNDQISGLVHVNYGGALIVSNNSATPLIVGQKFYLFTPPSPGSGNFSSVTILPSGSFTGTFDPTDGSVTIGSVTPPAPIVNPPTFSGGNMVMTGSGNPGDPYTWLSTTNLSAPIVWVTNSQGSFSASGTCTNSIVVTNPPTQFFRLRTP